MVRSCFDIFLWHYMIEIRRDGGAVAPLLILGEITKGAWGALRCLWIYCWLLDFSF